MRSGSSCGASRTNVDVTRGWTEMDATVRGKKFHFVNTHLEAFDNSPNGNPTNTNETVGNGEIREAQAKELFVGGGAASLSIGERSNSDDV